MSTPEMMAYEELLDQMEELLTEARRGIANPDFKPTALQLTKMEAVPGVSEAKSQEIKDLATRIRFFEVNFNVDIEHMLDERKRTMAEFREDYRPVVMYTIYRDDLEYPGDKKASLCAHSFVDAYRQARALRPELVAKYPGTGHGTKVTMYAKNLGQLLRAYRDVQDLGVPHALVIDRGHVLPPSFDGNPIVVALGIGPVYADEVAHITKRYSMKKP